MPTIIIDAEPATPTKPGHAAKAKKKKSKGKGPKASSIMSYLKRIKK